MRRGLVVAVGAAALIAGCSTTPEPPGEAIDSELADAPEWVRRGCSNYWKEDAPRRICGVGAMGGTRNAALARTGAMTRARTEIARSLQVQVEAMLRDYQATTTGGEEFGLAANDEQHVEDVSRQITEMSLSGTELVDSWISRNGTFYALVALDVESFRQTVSKMEQLSEAVRRAIIERAEKAFDDLDHQLERR
ncbi:MAG TPA: LPP20 family lipoprotein [Fredinandcohnia sp.]|nr:LPP20 family lipoprotein [Fredinandcohnia sp.]